MKHWYLLCPFIISFEATTPWTQSNMNPKFWLLVAFFMPRICIFEAAEQCGNSAEYSIRGMFLRGHTFKTYKIGLSEACYFKCTEEVTCQSYNVVIGQNICELNNRTMEARPKDFMPDWTRYYVKRAKNRGNLETAFTLQNIFPDSCQIRDILLTGSLCR